MRLKSCFKWILAGSPLLAAGQSFPITPYVNGVTSVKNGIIEAGPQYQFKKGTDATLVRDMRLSVRLPLSNQETNTVLVDRSLQSWRGVFAYNRTKNKAGEASGTPISRYGYGLQAEFGRNQFTYYPSGLRSAEAANTGNSYAGEFKFNSFWSAAVSGAAQHALQLRLRYSSELREADEVGVVGPASASGLVTSTMLVVEAPSRKATFSPAVAYQFYGGAGKFSYTPALYFDRQGGSAEGSPFVRGSGRYRAEAWVFYYPSGLVNVKIGLAPYVSIRAVGTDNLNTVEFGGQLSLKTTANFLSFFD